MSSTVCISTDLKHAENAGTCDATSLRQWKEHERLIRGQDHKGDATASSFR